jgi:hypothetical protein
MKVLTRIFYTAYYKAKNRKDYSAKALSAILAFYFAIAVSVVHNFLYFEYIFDATNRNTIMFQFSFFIFSLLPSVVLYRYLYKSALKKIGTLGLTDNIIPVWLARLIVFLCAAFIPVTVLFAVTL